MESVYWRSLAFLFVISLPGSFPRTLSTCENPIYVSCLHYKIMFVEINAANSLSSDILEKCNAQHECHVENPRKLCVNETYLCIPPGGEIFEISEKTNLQTRGKLSMFSLMSEGFMKGQIIDFHSIKCSLTPDKNEQETPQKQMQMVMNEFSPFKHPDSYCIYMENIQEPIQCSGSKDIVTRHSILPNHKTNGWHWNISFAGEEAFRPGIRFWIAIAVYPEDSTIYHLKCYSNQGYLEDNTEAKEQNGHIVAPYTAAAIGIVIVLSGLVICWKIRKSRMQMETENLQPIRDARNENVYIHK